MDASKDRTNFITLHLVFILFQQGGGSAPRSKPLPFHIPFLTEKVLLSYAFDGKKEPLSHTNKSVMNPIFRYSVQDILKRPYRYLNDSFPYSFKYLQPA